MALFGERLDKIIAGEAEKFEGVEKKGTTLEGTTPAEVAAKAKKDLDTVVKNVSPQSKVFGQYTYEGAGADGSAPGPQGVPSAVETGHVTQAQADEALSVTLGIVKGLMPTAIAAPMHGI